MFSIIALVNHEPQKRRAHKKSREGCLLCKARRLKCVEVKPLCGNCSRHFVERTACEYGSVTTAFERRKPENAAKSRTNTPESTLQASRVTEGQVHEDLLRRCLLPTSISAELLDPFLTHPPTTVKGVDFLMKYYLKTAVYTSFPWQPALVTNSTTKYYVPLVWTDPVLFHATLQLTLVRFQAHGTAIKEVSSSRVRGETIRLLRERVEFEGNDIKMSVSDQTINVVANLAATEHERGDMIMLKIHVDGMKRMIKLRGSLNAIRQTNPMVTNRIFWMFVVAMHEFPYPSLDPVLPPYCPDDHNLVSSLASSSFEDNVSGIIDPHSLKNTEMGLCRSVATVLVSIQHLSRMVPEQHTYGSAAISLDLLTRLCTLLSHLLSLPPIRILLPPQPCIEMDFPAVVSECTRYAILLYILAPWHGAPHDGRLAMAYLLHKLIEFLEELLVHPVMTKNVLVLWIFSVDGLASVELT